VAYAFRTFAKAPGFTAIAILVLAIGVGANTAIFRIVNEFLLRPLSGRTSELVGVYSHSRSEVDSFRLFSIPNYADLRDQSGLFDGSLRTARSRVDAQYRAGMHLEVRLEPGGDEFANIEALRAAIRATEPGLPVLTLSTMQAFHDKGLELWALRTGAYLFSALGGLALLLAVVGVYGVKSYIVSQRTREIGIRMALGASAGDVVGLVLRDGFFLTGAGVALGVPLAIVVSFALAAVFVDVGGFDGLVVSVATVVLAVGATIASAVPARRASRVQLLRALQGD